MPMNGMMRCVSVALIALAVAAPASAQRRGDQYRAYEARQAGQVMALRDIEERILPRMRGSTYLGPEFDGGVYRLKFMRAGSVFWVDVDARTGAVIGRSGF
ncbi:MAG: PepSY domain-containing protein [Proteobacteria bacterium]|nr:PepSY domain-containing protein [Pseudomonadota bacterium]